MIYKDEYAWLILLCANLKVKINENQQLNHGGPSQTYRKAPTHWLKLYEKDVIESEARTAVVHLKSEA